MKNKNFLKKLTAGLLGFVMTLGVGAAGYAASASEVSASSQTFSSTATTATNVNDGDITSTVNLSSPLKVMSCTNGASTKFYVKKDDFRMYATKQSYKGNYFTISVSSGYKINSITFNSDATLTTAEIFAGAVSVSSNQVTGTKVTGSNKVYTINSSECTVYNNNKSVSSNTQVKFKTIVIDYSTTSSTFNVSYDANKPSGVTADVSNLPSSVTGQTSYTIPTTAPSLNGYTFLGYSTTDSGDVAYHPGDPVTSTTTLFCQWELIKTPDYLLISDYTTTFYQNDTFSFDGEATVYYVGGGSRDVTSDVSVTITPDTSTLGTNKTAQVSYTENNVTVDAPYSIDVVEAPKIETLNTSSKNGGSGTYSSYSFGQGGAGTAPAEYNSGVRLYQGSSGGPGGFLLIEAKQGYDIVGFTVYTTSKSNNNVPIRYNATNTKVTSGNPTGDSTNSFTIGASDNVHKDVAACDYVYVINYGQSSSYRIEVLKVDVYYAAEAAVLNSIAITNQPTKTLFNIGDDFDSSGIVVTGTYSDESTENVTTDCNFSGYNMSTEGIQTVTVTYKQTSITTSYSITVVDPSEPVLQSITYTGTPVSPQYVGNAFNYEGLTFTGHYDKGDGQPIAGSAINWNALVADQNPSGTKDNVTVTITGVTVKTDVIESITVSGDMTKKSYRDGDEWDFAGLIVTGHYSSGATTDVTSSSTFASDTELINGVTSIKVTATYNSIPSDPYQITGLTVSAVVLYELVESVNQLVPGAKYTFGYLSTDTNIAFGTLGGSSTSTYFNTVNVAYNSSTKRFAEVDNLTTFTLGGTEGAYTFENDDGYLNVPADGNNLGYSSSIEDKAKWNISFNSDGVLSVFNNGYTAREIMRNGTRFASYKSTQEKVSLFKEISTAPSFAISPSAVTAHLYGDAVTAELKTENIPSPAFTIESNSDSTIASAAITTSGGKDVVSVSPLAAGSTTITVKETTKNKTATLAVTVDRIPASIEMFDKELETGHNVNKSTLLKVYDAGGTQINLSDCVVEWSIDDETVLQENDGSFTGLKQGDAEVSVSVAVPGGTALTGSCDISVVDDYPHPNTWSVTGTPTQMTYDAGDPFIPTGITVTYKTHFHHGSSDAEKTWSDLTKLLYTTSSEGVGKAYPYCFSSDDVSSASTTIYVYYEDEQIGSITGITVNAKEVPLESISFEEGEEDELERGEDLTLTPVYYPSNTTDARTLTWTVEQDSSGISVDENGKITIAKDAVVGNVGIVTATSTVSDDITAEFMVTVLREYQTVHVVDVSPESWDIVSDPSTLVAGDVVLLTGIKNDATYAAGTWSSGNNVPADADALTVIGSQITAGIKDEMKYTLEEGTVDGSVAFKDSNGKYLYAASSSSNYLKAQDSIDDNASFTIDSDSNVIATASSNRNIMRYNNNSSSNLFSCYVVSATGTITGTTVTFYKKTGGTVQKDIEVSDDLYEAVMDANELGMTATNWASISSLFSGFMSQTSSDEYKILTKGVAKADGNEVQKFLSDYATLVYAGCQDFLHRFTTYTVTFDSKGGSTVSPITAISGQKISAPTAPTKEGHGFDAWYNGDVVFDFANTPIESDLTLTAHWNITSYTVTLVGDHVVSDGDASCAYNAPYSATLSADDGYVLPASISVTCGGEEFDAYTYNSVTGLFTIEHMPAGNIVITATAKQGAYSISYAEADGTPIVESQLVAEYQSGVVTPLVGANNKTGYSFAGWYANTSLSGEPITEIGTTEKGNKIFYAKWTYSGQSDLNNVTTSMGMSYKYSVDGGEEHVSKAATGYVDYDMKTAPGFDEWGTSYAARKVEYDDIDINFESANHQTATITDIPVTKGNSVTIVAKNEKTIKNISAVFRQWGTNAHNITLKYSTDGGETFTNLEGSYSDFAYPDTALPAGTNAVEFNFSGTKQIGIESFSIKFGSSGPVYTSEFKWSIKNSGLASLVEQYGDTYDDIGIVVSYQGRDRYFSFIQADDGKYYIHEEGKEDLAFSFSKDGSSFAINLGDILQNIDRAEVDFTVTAYIKENGQTHLSENSTTYSVIDWVDEYYGDGKTKYSEAVEDIWTILHSLLDE